MISASTQSRTIFCACLCSADKAKSIYEPFATKAFV
jgi:hypothetical protein